MNGGLRFEASAEGVRMTCTDAEGFTATAFRKSALTAAQRPEANAGSLRTQAARSGETIFAVRSVEVRGGEWFVPASLAAEVRREVLDGVNDQRRSAIAKGAAQHASLHGFIVNLLNRMEGNFAHSLDFRREK